MLSQNVFLPEYLSNSPLDTYSKSLIFELPLPSCWNSEDRAPHIKVSEDGVGLSYTGTQAYSKFDFFLLFIFYLLFVCLFVLLWEDEVRM